MKKKCISFEKNTPKIYGPTLEEGVLRRKHNREIRDLFGWGAGLSRGN